MNLKNVLRTAAIITATQLAGCSLGDSEGPSPEEIAKKKLNENYQSLYLALSDDLYLMATQKGLSVTHVSQIIKIMESFKNNIPSDLVTLHKENKLTSGTLLKYISPSLHAWNNQYYQHKGCLKKNEFGNVGRPDIICNEKGEVTHITKPKVKSVERTYNFTEGVVYFYPDKSSRSGGNGFSTHTFSEIKPDALEDALELKYKWEEINRANIESNKITLDEIQNKIDDELSRFDIGLISINTSYNIKFK